MQRSRPDHYRVLQVDPAANPLVIQAAFRVLAQIWHPDVSGDDEEMKRINAAWEVLGDPKRRKQYDIERAGRHPGAVEQHPRQPERTTDRATERPASASSAFGRASAGAFAAGAQAGSTAGAARSTASVAPARGVDHAGPPPGRPFGPVLRFGRYEGWSLGEISQVDRPFLEWLKRAPAGRGLGEEIDAVLRTRKGPGAVDARRHYETQQQQQVHAWRSGAPTKVG